MKHAYISMLLVSSFLLACSFAAIAQVSVEWDKTLGGSVMEVLEAVTTSSDGGYLLAGYSASNASGDKSEDSKGNYDYWIVKIDAEGNKQWDKSFGGENVENLNDVVSTPDGGYLLAGRSYSEGIGDYIEYDDCDPYSSYYYACYSSNYWIIKINAEGNKQWEKIFGINSINEELGNVIISPEGGYLLAGSSYFTWDEYESSTDYWIIKIDESGNKEWEKNFGGDNSDYLRTAVTTPDGGYLLAGYSSSYASRDKSENNKEAEDYWIIKIDAEGNKQWDKTYGTDRTDELNSAIATTDGGYLLAGSSYIEGDDERYYSDYWVVKVDSQGNKKWEKTFGGNDIFEDDFLTSVVETDEGYLLGGTSLADYWTIKIDTEGNRLWDRKWSGNNSEYLTDIASTPEGEYLLAGWSNSDASGDKTEDSKGSFDYWIIKIKETEEKFSVNNFALVNAETDEEIQEINHGDIIDLATLSSTKLSIVANTQPNQVGSVAFRLEGPFIHGHTENYAPYAIFGDKAGDFSGRLLPPGEYTLVATPYAGKGKTGTAGTPLEINFTIIHSEEIEDAQVTGFDLYDAITDQKIMDLEDGTVIHKDELEHEELTVLMHTVPDFVGSVKVELWGPLNLTRIENIKPYALFRNNSKDLFGQALLAGDYTLRATPYTEANAQGETGMPLEVNFTVVGEDNNNARLAAYPVPTSGVVNISYQGSAEQADLMLLDFTGQPLLTLPLKGQTQLDLSSYRKGIYYLKVVDQQGVHLKRVVVE